MPRALPGPLRELLFLQAGTVTRPQAAACGLSASALDSLVRSGRWRRVRPGVYAAFTGLPPRHAALWAAVLGAGDGAALSYRTAAELYGLVSPAEPIHVTIPAARRIMPMAGVTLHRSRLLDLTRHPARPDLT